MAFKEVASLDAENTIAIGGVNKKTGKKNPASAEGYYLGSRKVANKNGESSIHFLQTPQGNLGVWGKTDMDRKLGGVVAGTMIRISFTGMTATPRGDMYKYKVEVDNDNTIAVDTTLAANNTGADEGESYDSGADNDGEEDSYEEEESSQSAALAALERKAKVEALLKGKGRPNRN
jgi:hypothetical protein